MRRWFGGILALLCIFSAAGSRAQTSDALAEAKEAIARNNYLRAYQLLLPLARGGNPKAQTQLGLMYHHGQGVREDDAQAFAWFQRGALAGDAEAQYQLANMYTYGFGVPTGEQDPDRMAARWYFEAAIKEHADAQYSLGILFFSGKGVVQSNEEALKWFRRAAGHGHSDARRFIDQHAQPR